MLFPVQCECGRRLWAEISITYDKRIYANSIDEVAEYILKHAIVKETYDEVEILPDIQKTLAGLLKVTSKAEAVKEVSQLYGIPEEYVAELLENLAFQEALSC